MKKFTSKIISVILACVMVLCLCGFTVKGNSKDEELKFDVISVSMRFAGLEPYYLTNSEINQLCDSFSEIVDSNYSKNWKNIPEEERHLGELHKLAEYEADPELGVPAGDPYYIWFDCGKEYIPGISYLGNYVTFDGKAFNFGTDYKFEFQHVIDKLIEEHFGADSSFDERLKYNVTSVSMRFPTPTPNLEPYYLTNSEINRLCDALLEIWDSDLYHNWKNVPDEELRFGALHKLAEYEAKMGPPAGEPYYLLIDCGFEYIPTITCCGSYVTINGQAFDFGEDNKFEFQRVIDELIKEHFETEE